jgi:septum formation protein
MTGTKVKLVLASASPRRLSLLERAGITPDLLNPTDIDEHPEKRETPRRLALRLAEEKARTAADAPMVKELGPKAPSPPIRCRAHRRGAARAETRKWFAVSLACRAVAWVYSAVCLIAPGGTADLETKVRFKRFSREDVEAYRQQRVARQGRRICYPGPGGGICPPVAGIAFGRCRLAAL